MAPRIAQERFRGMWVRVGARSWLLALLTCALAACGTVQEDISDTGLARAGATKVHIIPRVDAACGPIGNEYLYDSARDTEDLEVDIERDEAGLQKLKVRVGRVTASNALAIAAPAMVEVRGILAARDAKLAEELAPAVENVLMRALLGAMTGGAGGLLSP